MCGIAGWMSGGWEAAPVAGAMQEALRHRGPDDGGVWSDPEAGLTLLHRRLAIVDLSPQGHQPMRSASGRYVLVFNGEIYNHRQLRRELASLAAAPVWRGHSDTEVMLRAFEQWGIEASLARFNGMFAFALWDTQDRLLYLARDRLGEKPLYYGWQGETFLFGSELKALRAHPAWRGEINRDALALYLRHNCVPAPYTIYRDVRKLPPGQVLCVRLAGGKAQLAEQRAYWSAKAIAEAGRADPCVGDDAGAVAALEGLLKDAVALRMEADVPLGAFLSGGIDSSAVVALMQAQSARPVKTFSIGFHEAGYNEAEHAKAVARHLGTDHTELYVTPEQAMAVVPRLPQIYDEPFADSSQIPTFLVSEMTRRHVTVALSGDAGDELFGGYNRYVWGRDLWRRVGWLPVRLRRAAAAGLTALAPQSWDGVFQLGQAALPESWRVSRPGDKLHKFAGILGSATPEAMYRGLVSHWDGGGLVLGASEPPTVLTDLAQWADLPDFTQRMMFLDLISYLPDDILAKVDRASMAVSLEARVPFLDHRVVELAWRLPLSMKIRSGEGKWILRQVLYQYVPKALIERPKMGFGVPLDVWLRGPLREWAASLLDEARLRREGFFNPTPIRQKWQEHLSGKRNWAYHLWDVLMFQAWLESSRP